MVHGKNRIPYWIDRRLNGLAGPEYHAIISFGLPIEPEDSQYGEYRIRWLWYLLVVLALGIPTGSCLPADEPNEIRDTLEERGLSEEEVALMVNGHPVTVDEFLRAREEDTTGRARVESTFGRVVPDDDPSLPTEFKDCLECFAEHMDDPTKPLPESYVALFPALELYLTYPALELYLTYSIDAVALAGILLDYTAYAAGVEAGYTMTVEEVQEAVDKIRFYYDNQGKTVPIEFASTGEFIDTYIDPDPEREAFIKAIGGEEYWTKYLPDKERRDGIAAKWRGSMYAPLYARSATEEEVNQVTWNTYVELIRDATVEFTGTIDIDATPEQSLQLIRDATVEFTGTIDIDATPEQSLQFLVDKARAEGYEISTAK